MISFAISESKHQQFSELSGDLNPFHVDKIYSRRSIVGHRVVHGINLVLSTLDVFYESQDLCLSIDSLKAQFIKDVSLGERIEVKVRERKDEKILEGFSKDQKKFKLRLKLREQSSSVKKELTAPLSRIEMRENVSSLQVGFGESFSLGFDKQSLEGLYPKISQILERDFFDSVLATTRCVGMRCPGLNSIFSKLEIKKVEDDQDEFSYSIRKRDERFGLFLLDWKGRNYRGSIDASLRPLPVSQPHFSAIQSRFSKKLLESKKSLVIGGSRGIGEVVSKILAAQGSKVCLSYSVGEKEAASIVKELPAGLGSAFKVDILEEMTKELREEVMKENFDYVFFFASPKIQSNRNSEIDMNLIEKYREYYIEGFKKIVNIFNDRELPSFFFPSTEFLNHDITEFREYCQVKQEGEELVDQLNQKFDREKILSYRIPKLITDQTNSFTQNSSLDNISVLEKFLSMFFKTINEGRS